MFVSKKLRALMNLVSIKAPASQVSSTGEPPEFRDTALGIVAARQFLQMIANSLVETLAESFCPFSGAFDSLLVNGKGEVHRHRICAHLLSAKANYGCEAASAVASCASIA